MPGYFGSRWGVNHWKSPEESAPGESLTLVYTEPFRRDLTELNADLYDRAVRLVLTLPGRHLNDPQSLMPRDSRVLSLDDDSGLRLTYIIVLSLGELIVARIEYNAPPS